MAYTAPAQGTSGYGGAKFGAGGGGPNRYDFTQWGGGLWSIGIDPAKSGYYDDVIGWYNNQPSNVKSEVDAYWKNNKRTGNYGFDLANAVDWRQRDVARKIQKEPGFFDFLGPLAPVGGALATAAGSVLGGPIGGALAGGLAGGLGSKSVLGGLLGAAGGYFGGGLLNKFGVPTNVLGVPGGGTVSGLYGSLIPAVGNVNQYMPADIAARAAQGANYGGLAPIVDKSVQVATQTPPGVFEASMDALKNAASPTSLLGGVANNMMGNLAMNAIGGFLGGEPEAGGGLMGSPSANTWGVNPYNKSPYPELFMRPRRGISNQLTGMAGVMPIGNATMPSMPELIPNALPGAGNWSFL